MSVYIIIAAREDMRRMVTLRSQLADIHHVLDVINNDPSGTTALGKNSCKVWYNSV